MFFLLMFLANRFTYTPSICDRILPSTRKTIPLVSDYEPGYMSTSESSQKWLDSKKALFVLDTQLVSSVYPEDPRLIELCKLLPPINRRSPPQQREFADQLRMVNTAF
jgi:hypothetical protein